MKKSTVIGPKAPLGVDLLFFSFLNRKKKSIIIAYPALLFNSIFISYIYYLLYCM